MEKSSTDSNDCKSSPLASTSPDRPNEKVNGEDCTESNSLLVHRKGHVSRKSEKTRRKVQWNDSNGNKLAEVLVFEPSDASDSEDEAWDPCFCIIM